MTNKKPMDSNIEAALCGEISLSRSRVYDMLEDLGETNLLDKLSKNDWTVISEIRKLYVENASFDESTTSIEGAMSMAETDIEVLLMEMGMIPKDQLSIDRILCEVEKVAIPEDIGFIERVRKANGPESTVADLITIMEGVHDMMERPETCYTILLTECVENIVNQTEVGENEIDDVDWAQENFELGDESASQN